MATGMWAMDGNQNAGNGWQLECWAMDGNWNVGMDGMDGNLEWQWMATRMDELQGMRAMATGIAGNGWQPGMWGNGWQLE